MQTKVDNCNNAYKSSHLLYLHAKAIGAFVSKLVVFSRNLKFVVKTMIQFRCDGACKHIKLKSCRFHAVKMMVRQIKWIHATEMNLFVKEIKYCL